MKLLIKLRFTILLLASIVLFSSSYTFVDKDPGLLEMSLKNLKGDTFSLGNIKNNSASIFIFFLPDCPLAQNYTLTVKELSKKFKEESPKVYFVIPGSDYSNKEIKVFRDNYQIGEFHILLDSDYQLATYLGASISPESFLIDKNGDVQYQGAIDNWAYELGKKRKVITEKYLEEALNAHYKQSIILTKKTKAIGCFLNMPNHKEHHSQKEKHDSHQHHNK
ncbi:redoxin domain-containing protein [Chondrinema litorale]|uniref:redoxin domain-containing protein n=1 Tax=Chondrinema litorale TaxID=2994555 RepID=UPI002542EBD2|nr:redoxin domain-containing protein [Chondrinema litorale]UZR99251.1 redoxin domain-containing protein [Chondrinema litorale]